MSIGSWSPDAQQQAETLKLNQDDILLLIKLADDTSLADLPNILSGDEQQRLSALLSPTLKEWAQALEGKSAEQLWLLIRFFTVAEMKLAGWQCGNDSPVIKINKILKTQNLNLNKEQLLWIRNNSTNRYIPNGAVML